MNHEVAHVIARSKVLALTNVFVVRELARMSLLSALMLATLSPNHDVNVVVDAWLPATTRCLVGDLLYRNVVPKSTAADDDDDD